MAFSIEGKSPLSNSPYSSIYDICQWITNIHKQIEKLQFKSTSQNAITPCYCSHWWKCRCSKRGFHTCLWKKKQFQFKIVGSYFICHPLTLNSTKKESWFENKAWLALTLIYLYKPTTYKSGVLFNEYKYCKPLHLYEH